MNKSTLLDLNLISENSENDSFLNRFDFTKNDLSKEKLKYFLIGDIRKEAEILSVQEMLKYVIAHTDQLDLKITNSENYYLSDYLKYDKVIIKRDRLYDKVKQYIKKTIRYKPHVNIITSGVTKLIIFFDERWRILRNLKLDHSPADLNEKIKIVSTFISEIKLSEISQSAYDGNIPFLKILELDHYFRFTKKETILQILDIFYEIEALVSISKAAKRYELVFPEVSDTSKLSIRGLFHPFVKNCVRNDFEIDEKENLIFLTGPNMSGKSTFLKSVGVTVYLALRGLPAPVQKASVPFFDEILININTQDDIFNGDSYFLSELKKVKEIAVKLNEGKKCFVIFDELFKGTNFIDSKECSKLVINGFTKFSTSKFIISTHMIELFSEMPSFTSTRSIYLDTTTKNGQPSFTYNLKPGISQVRLGLFLLEREGIKDLLFDGNLKTQDSSPTLT
jgi:DNA mismatch repair ATPase MutS